MKVKCITRGRDGSRIVKMIDYVKFVLKKRPFRPRPRSPQRRGQGGYWQLSTSCGVPAKQLAEAQKLDAELGVPIDYVRRGQAALAAFANRSEKRAWLRAHKWVDHDAGYRDPCPGDFTEKR